MKKKFVVTFDDVVSIENLCAAWQEFIRGKRSKKDVQAFQQNLGDEIVRLHDNLMAGTYRHGCYAYFPINDPKPRSIHKASVRDRLLHHALYRRLYPLFAPTFIADSFSCQTGKGVHRALRRFRAFTRIVTKNGTVTCWILKCDIRKFFASIDHGILIALLATRIDDDRMLGLLACILESFSVMPGVGLPLGNLTSQLFANVYMHEFDVFMKRKLRVPYYIRYADDFAVLSRDRQSLMRLCTDIAGFLSRSLALQLHPKKVSLETLASGVDFLGWVHFPSHSVPRATTRRRAERRLKNDVTPEVLSSYLGLLRHGDAHHLCRSLQNEYWLWNVQ